MAKVRHYRFRARNPLNLTKVGEYNTVGLVSRQRTFSV